MKTTMIATIYVLFASIELSADVANLNTLGISPDGKVLAYEQYGVLDGSGFSYAERSYISTITGSHLAGSPVAILDENYADDSKVARTQAKIEAVNRIGVPEYLFSNATQKVLAKRIITEVVMEPHAVQFHSHVEDLLSGQKPIEIHLEPIPYPAEEDCSYFQGEALRFKLTFQRPGEQKSVLRIDGKEALRGQGCVIEYQVSEVSQYTTVENNIIYSIVILVKSVGFEGPNIRWITLVHPPDLFNAD